MAPAKIPHMESLVQINGCESWTEKMIGYKSVCITSRSFVNMTVSLRFQKKRNNASRIAKIFRIHKAYTAQTHTTYQGLINTH